MKRSSKMSAVLAVSYDWGAVADPEGVLVDEQHLVTSTILAALCALRYVCVDDI